MKWYDPGTRYNVLILDGGNSSDESEIDTELEIYVLLYVDSFASSPEVKQEYICNVSMSMLRLTLFDGIKVHSGQIMPISFVSLPLFLPP